jgi:ubiquinone/menaquinone biosynthesis C-methylase UbiE
MDNNIQRRTEATEYVAEFDKFAADYSNLHKENISITGEDPEFFSEYKIKIMYDIVRKQNQMPQRIFDFGCGIGGSIPFFKKYFNLSSVTYGDVSEKSLLVAKGRFPDLGDYCLIKGNIPLKDESQDIIFSACVFHHIEPNDRFFWLKELYRVTNPGGLLVIFEHNPLNPLTVKAVKSCLFDATAQLIYAYNMKRLIESTGWKFARARYSLFFPSFLRFLRPFEKLLRRIPFGGQYFIIAYK